MKSCIANLTTDDIVQFSSGGGLYTGNLFRKYYGYIELMCPAFDNAIIRVRCDKICRIIKK
jgi:hypothetical protein